MKQNLVVLNLSETQLAAAALIELETQLPGLVARAPGEKKRMQPMGERSEAFCHQALRLLSENPQVVPPNIDVAAAVRDLAMRDVLRPRSIRLSRLMLRVDQEQAV